MRRLDQATPLNQNQNQCSSVSSVVFQILLVIVLDASMRFSLFKTNRYGGTKGVLPLDFSDF